MAKVVYSNQNRGFWDLYNFDLYDTVFMSKRKIVLEWGAENEGAFGPYDIDAGHAFKVVLFLKGAQYKVPATGPFAGMTIATRGEVTGFRLFDQNGNLILSGTGFSASLKALQKAYLTGDGWGIFETLYSEKLTILGANSTGSDVFFQDDIRSGFGNDVVKAGGGSDWIIDYGGKDVYDGGKGFDKLGSAYVFDVERGIVANLIKGTFRGTDGKIDKIRNIEGIRGTDAIDKMIGNKADNSFRGLDGNDVFDGKGGEDVAIYSDDARFGGTKGVVVNLSVGSAIDGFGAIDRLINVENAYGTVVADVFIDDAANNYFWGNAGDDILQFSQGDDAGEGGSGADTFVFIGTDFGRNEIFDFEDGTDRLAIDAITDLSEVTISVDGDAKLIAWNGNEIRLLGGAGLTITADDFIFS